MSTAFAGAKLETLLVSNKAASSPSSVATSPAQIGLFGNLNRARRSSLHVQRGYSAIRCEVSSPSSDVLDAANAVPSSTSSSSLSALQQLKTSAADSNSLLLLFSFFFFFLLIIRFFLCAQIQAFW